MLCAMDISAFRRSKEMTQAELAAFLTTAGVPATQALISQWERGATIPAERAAAIERVTCGQITRAALRPDLFAQPEPNANAA